MQLRLWYCCCSCSFASVPLDWAILVMLNIVDANDTISGGGDDGNGGGGDGGGDGNGDGGGGGGAAVAAVAAARSKDY